MHTAKFALQLIVRSYTKHRLQEFISVGAITFESLHKYRAAKQGQRPLPSIGIGYNWSDQTWGFAGKSPVAANFSEENSCFDITSDQIVARIAKFGKIQESHR